MAVRMRWLVVLLAAAVALGVVLGSLAGYGLEVALWSMLTGLAEP